MPKEDPPVAEEADPVEFILSDDGANLPTPSSMRKDEVGRLRRPPARGKALI
ncbi:MAG: hypothetical protein HY459_02275 [Parcubacteria group bacterium]|nr:hypothetical protein [Parcubacteria group bacterium]